MSSLLVKGPFVELEGVEALLKPSVLSLNATGLLTRTRGAVSFLYLRNYFLFLLDYFTW